MHHHRKDKLSWIVGLAALCAMPFASVKPALAQDDSVSSSQLRNAPTSFIFRKDINSESWWLRTKLKEYQEKYPSYTNDEINTFVVVGRTRVNGSDGTIVRDMSRSLELFLPDTGTGNYWAALRDDSSSPWVEKWRPMLNIKRDLRLVKRLEKHERAQRRSKQQIIAQFFGNTPVYDSHGKRYKRTSRFVPNRAYYNARGQRIVRDQRFSRHGR